MLLKAFHHLVQLVVAVYALQHAARFKDAVLVIAVYAYAFLAQVNDLPPNLINPRALPQPLFAQQIGLPGQLVQLCADDVYAAVYPASQYNARF